MTGLCDAFPVYSTSLKAVASGYLKPCSNLGISSSGGSLQTGIMEVKEVRKRNLALLIGRSGGNQASFARSVGASPNYINQLLNGWQGRGVGDSLARRIERKAAKPKGWMDTPHSDEWRGIDTMAAQRTFSSGGSSRSTWILAELDSLSDNSVNAVLSLIEQLKLIEAPPPSVPHQTLHVRK